MPNIMEWYDDTDYHPTAYGDGYDRYEPYWRFTCPVCEHRIFDTPKPPEECPNCKTKLRKPRW